MTLKAANDGPATPSPPRSGPVPASKLTLSHCSHAVLVRMHDDQGRVVASAAFDVRQSLAMFDELGHHLNALMGLSPISAARSGLEC